MFSFSSHYVLVPVISFSLVLFCSSFWFDFVILQELDIAVVRATNHVERPAKEKHVRGGCSLWIICCVSNYK